MEVRATINENPLPLRSHHQSRGTQTMIIGIIAMTDRTATAYFGDTRTGTRTEEDNLHEYLLRKVVGE